MGESITFIKQPDYIAYSKNPIEIEVELTSVDNYVLLKVLKSTGEVVATLYGRPDEYKRVTFYIDPILDTIVDFSPPNPISSGLRVYDPVAKYVLRADEYNGGISVSGILTSDRYVLKGGLSQEKLNINIFDKIKTEKRFLTWATEVDVYAYQPYYFYYINLQETTESLTAKAKVYYTDGTYATTDIVEIINVNPYGLIYVSAGFNANGLDILTFGKNPYKYEIWIENTDSDIRAGEITLWLSDKYVATQKNFFYANSLGGFEGLFSSGQKNKVITGSYESANHKNSSGQMQSHTFNHLSSRNGKVASGHKSKAEIDRLADIFNSNHIYEVEGNELVQLKLNNGTKLDYNEDDNLFGFVLDYNRITTNKNYTPDDIS